MRKKQTFEDRHNEVKKILNNIIGLIAVINIIVILLMLIFVKLN